MGRVILFSPVGGTDPISETNCFDGSLLHICRWHKPDVVYLYFSQEMLNNENKDHRIHRALELLEKKIQHKFEIIPIEKPDLDNPQDLDYFFRDFREELLKISNNLNDDKLLLNVASGTPAMKSALNTLSVLGEIKASCIQVLAPNRKIGEHIHSEIYDIDALWAKDPDNKEGAENRSKIIHCPNLLSIINKETIRNFINKFDYHAALDMAKKLPKEIKNKIYDYIKIACERSDFNTKSAEELSKNLDCENLFPIQDESVKYIFEYFLISEIKLRKKEYADFIRSITPMILDIFIRITTKSVYPVEDLFKDQPINTKSKESKKVWDVEKLEELNDNSEGNIPGQILDILKDLRAINKYGYADISSVHLLKLLKKHEDKVSTIIEELKTIRFKIENLRNISAHQMVQLDNEKILKFTQLNPKELLAVIKKAICYAGDLEFDSQIWNSYEDMNKFIIQKMKE